VSLADQRGRQGAVQNGVLGAVRGDGIVQ